MNLAKAIFVLFLVIYNAVGIAHGLISALILDTMTFAWMASMVSNATLSCFFLVYLFMLKPARTSPSLPGILVVTTSSAIIILADVTFNQFQIEPIIYGIICGCFGAYLFVFWYSDLGRGENSLLQIGNKLPDLSLERYDGKRLDLSCYAGRPVLYVFYPGNWCPLSLSQIAELSDQIDAFVERDVVLVLISPQPREQSEALAITSSTKMHFVVDNNCSIARQLGICYERGLPMGFEILGYEADTVYPTVVIADGNGRIIYTDLTENYRVRPTTTQLLTALNKTGVAKAAVDFMPHSV